MTTEIGEGTTGFSWESFTEELHGDLTVVDDRYLIEHSFEYFKVCLERTGDFKKARDSFFRHALLGFYDCMFDGLKEKAGQWLYRLSDHLSEVERFEMEIYPSETGSLAPDGGRWDSLEDWRRQWESYHFEIPRYDFGRGLIAAFG